MIDTPSDPSQYDSPPIPSDSAGRFSSLELSVLYGSQDVEVCLHECRVTKEDKLFLATLAPTRDLVLIDLSGWIQEPNLTEFESLSLAVSYLFSANHHAYEICRRIAAIAYSSGLDGIIYPSYFSHLRIRKNDHSKHTIENIALFGRPIKDGNVNVRCMNRLVLDNVVYHYSFGPDGVS
jgi:hypothetical protein